MSVRVRRGFLVTAGACLAVTLLFAWAAPNLLRWRIEQGNHSVTHELRQMDAAVKAYIEKHGTVPPALSSLRGNVNSALACDTPACDFIGYRFQYAVLSPDPRKPRYSLSAQPTQHGVTGVRSYYLDQTGILRCTSAPRAATSDDPPWTP